MTGSCRKRFFRVFRAVFYWVKLGLRERPPEMLGKGGLWPLTAGRRELGLKARRPARLTGGGGGQPKY